MRFLSAVLSMVLVFSPVAPTGAQEEAFRWQAPRLRDHPLVGRIWDVKAGAFIRAGELLDRMESSEFVLLGETHDNPDHHRLQARLIEALAARGRRPSVVFEIFDRADQAAIDRVRRGAPAAVEPRIERLAEATNLVREGWPWALYRPLMRTVMALDLPMIGADLAPREMRAVVDNGLTALGAERVEAWGLDRPLQPRYELELRQILAKSHCGHAPAALIEGMIAAQRARDAALADALVAHAHPGGAVLIAGAGHVRNDWAVPAYLRRRVPRAASLSLAFTEVRKEAVLPAEYAGTAADYLWFTPAARRQDPCAQFSPARQ